MKKWLSALALILILLAVGWSHVATQFMFNPLVFKQDEVTPLSWASYPRSLELELRRPVASSHPIRIIDREEIGFVLGEMKQGVISKVDDIEGMEYIDIVLREKGTRGDKGIIHRYKGQLGVHIYAMKLPLTITDELDAYLRVKLKEWSAHGSTWLPVEAKLTRETFDRYWRLTSEYQ